MISVSYLISIDKFHVSGWLKQITVEKHAVNVTSANPAYELENAVSG